MRDLSCYCQDCLVKGPQSKCGWTFKTFVKKADKTNRPSKSADINNNEKFTVSSNNELQIPEESSKKEKHIEVKTGYWVAAVYESVWYIGQVTEFETDSDDCQINFLEKSSKYAETGTYKFPLRKDEIWI